MHPMGEEKKPNLGEIYQVGNILQYCRMKAQAQTALKIKEQFKVRGNKGEGSLVEALELTNSILKDFNITPQVQQQIQSWIDNLNKAYVQASKPVLDIFAHVNENVAI